MKIVLTGSLGRIGKPLAKDLLAKGHEVTIISSNPDKSSEIELMGARAAIGTIDDVAFLARTFEGADIVYLMEPPIDFLNPDLDIQDYWISIVRNYKDAVLKAGVKNIVHLSSIGGHTDEGVGMLKAHYYCEQILKELPGDVNIKTMRPVGFYYNMFAFIPAIKNAGNIFQNYGGNEKEPWASPSDIAHTISEEIDSPFDGRSVRYIASDEVSPNDVAKILGEAIGKADLNWVKIPTADFVQNLLRAGFSSTGAEGLAAMNEGRTSGALYADYFKNRPTLGKVKLDEFAKDFAKVYTNS